MGGFLPGFVTSRLQKDYRNDLIARAEWNRIFLQPLGAAQIYVLLRAIASRALRNGYPNRRKSVEHNLEYSICLLERTPATLNVLLRDLPEPWTMRNEGEKTWSAFDVIGHLIHGERTDWMPRARTILQFGDSRAFERFDRWGQERESRGKSLAELLDEFARLRTENLRQLRSLKLQPEDFERRGRHPELGSVTLSELLATRAVHDLTHLHQISRIMAHQYREAVGAWRAYLGVLRCAGHSS